MAKDRSKQQGIQTSLYLTAKRQQILSRFGKDFRQAVYKLIDQAVAETSEDAPQQPISPVEAPKDALDVLDKPTVAKRGEMCIACRRKGPVKGCPACDPKGLRSIR
jgi:hypothetical protein